MKVEAKRLIVTRGLPKTGDVDVISNYSDGYYHVGWWKGKTYADNKTRFKVKTLNGDEVVLDLATGLMWAGKYNEEGCNNNETLVWSDALDYCHNLSFAGFADWRLANVLEMLSIINFDASYPAFYPEFGTNSPATVNHTSTTTSVAGPDIVIIDCSSGTVDLTSDESSLCLRAVRGGV